MDLSSFSLNGKVAAVTGASRGIGLALARALAAAGADVAALVRDAGSATVGRPIRVDVQDPASIERAFDEAAGAFGRLDILINNAGVEELRPSIDVDPPLWDRIVDTNLKGAFFCAQAAARRFGAGGVILNVCSLTSEVGVPGAAAYGASKSGLAGLTRALATEWAGRGIRVNAIGPGYFRTALTETFYQDAAWQARMLDKIPMRRFGELADLAGTAVFLCSDASAYVTGQVIYVDGGYLASI